MNSALYDLFDQSAYIVVVFLLPMVILVKLTLRLRSAIQWSERRHNAHTHGHVTTKLVIAVVILFIVCYTPSALVTMMFLINRLSPFISAEWTGYPQYLMAFSQTLMILNSAVNFLVYVFFNQRFRKRLSGMVTSSCCLVLRTSEQQTEASIPHHNEVHAYVKI